LIYAADQAASVHDGARLGVHARVDRVDWPAIVDRVFGRIDPIAAGGEDYRTNRCPNITVFRGEARFVADKTLEVDGQRITAPQIILAAGARPHVPSDIEGLDRVPFHTSDTIMRLSALPERQLRHPGRLRAALVPHAARV
jgi:mycothione reductase